MSTTLCYVCRDSGLTHCSGQGGCIQAWRAKGAEVQRLAMEREASGTLASVAVAERHKTSYSTLRYVTIQPPDGRPKREGNMVIHDRIQSGIKRAGIKLGSQARAIIGVRHAWNLQDTKDRHMRRSIRQLRKRMHH